VSPAFIVHHRLIGNNILGNKDDKIWIIVRCLSACAIVTEILCVKFIPVTQALVIIFTSPIYALIFARLFLNEPFGKYELVMVLLTVSGVVIVINPIEIIQSFKTSTPVMDHAIGYSLAFATALGIAASTVVFRRLNHFHVAVHMFLGSASTAILSLILVFSLDEFLLPTSKDIPILLISIATGISQNLLMTLAAHFTTATTVSMVLTTSVIFAALYQLLLFNDAITLTTVVGSVLVCLSILLLNSKENIIIYIKGCFVNN